MLDDMEAVDTKTRKLGRSPAWSDGGHARTFSEQSRNSSRKSSSFNDDSERRTSCQERAYGWHIYLATHWHRKDVTSTDRRVKHEKVVVEVVGRLPLIT